MRNALSEYDMVEDVQSVRVRTADKRLVLMPIRCGQRLSAFFQDNFAREQTNTTYVSSLLTAGQGMLSWASSASSPPPSTGSDVFEAGCSSESASRFIVSYFKGEVALESLFVSPSLLMETLELAHCIESDELFHDGCELLGRLLQASTRYPLLAFLDGSLPASEMYVTFKEIVETVRTTFRLPRLSRVEDALLEEEIRQGANGVTVSVMGDDSSEQTKLAGFEDAMKFMTSFQTHTWQPNADCVYCPDCNKPLKSYFGIQTAGVLSHCRVCGKGKCSNCVGFRVHKVNALVERPHNEPPDQGNFRKACSKCFQDVVQNTRYAFLSNAFMWSGMSVLEISIMRFVSDQWRRAAELCLREYHHLLYTSPSSLSDAQFPKAMSKLIRSSAPFYEGHSQAIVFLARALDWHNEEAETVDAVSVILRTCRGLICRAERSIPIPHLHMFCTRACTIMAPELCGYQLLEVLHQLDSTAAIDECRRLAKDLILCGQSDVSIVEAIIPLLMDLASRCSEAADCVIEICGRQPSLSLRVYLEAQSRARMIHASELMTSRARTEAIRELCVSVEQKSMLDRERLCRTGLFLEVLDSIRFIGDVDTVNATFVKQANAHNIGASPVDIDSKSYRENDFLLRPFIYPFDSAVTIVAIRLADTQLKKLSNSKPTIYHLIDSDGGSRRVLFKRECVRKDAAVSSITAMLNAIIAKQNWLWPPKRDKEITLQAYGVVPVSGSSGLIEIVEGQTLQRIFESAGDRVRSASVCTQSPPGSLSARGSSTRKHGPGPNEVASKDTNNEPTCNDDASSKEVSSASFAVSDGPLLSVLKALRPDPSASETSQQRLVGRRFLASAKIFLVLNYLLAIGDRHRDNVILTPEGYLLHIDFGYILGSRPLPEKQLVGSKAYVRFDGDLDACVRYYQRLLHTLDGQPVEGTDGFNTFVQQVADLFLNLRPHSYALLIVLQHLVNTNVLEEVNVSEALRNITLGGSSRDEARNVFMARIRQSLGAEATRDWVYSKAKSIKALLF